MNAVSLKNISNSIAGCKQEMLQKLIDNGVVYVARKDGAIYSKRLIRDELGRRHKAANGKKGMKSRWQNDNKPDSESITTPITNHNSSSSTSVINNNTHEKRGAVFGIEQVRNTGFKLGVPDDKAEGFYHHYNAQGWVFGNGQPVTDLISAMTKWRNKQYKFEGKNGRATTATGKQKPKGFAEQESNIERKFDND